MAGAAVIYIIWAIEAAIMGVLVYRYVHSQPMILLEPAMSIIIILKRIRTSTIDILLSRVELHGQ